MAERLFRVDELAQLCGVDPETVRRWRNKGVRGVFLKSTNTSLLKGKNLLFQAQAVRDFARAYPKIMTPALKKELEKDETAKRDLFQLAGAGGTASVMPANDSDDEFIMRLLLEKRAALLKDLEQTEKSIARLKGGDGM